MSVKKTYNIILAVMMVLMFIAPANALPDNPPTSTISANDHNPDSVAVLTAVSVDTLANAGVDTIKIYEDGQLIGTKDCNLYSSCVYVKTVVHNSAGSHEYYSIAKDRAGQTRKSSTKVIDFQGDNQAPIIDSQSPSSPISVQESQGVTLEVDAHDPDGDTLEYEWYVDGASQGIGSDSYNFAPQVDSDTTYNVAVKVRDGKGGVDIAAWQVEIIDEPTTVSITGDTPISECEAGDYTATVNSNTGIDNYEWDFGDGTSDSGSTLNQVSHSFPGNDTYTVTVTVEDNDQRTAQDSMQVVVEDDSPEVEIIAEDEWPVQETITFSSNVVDSCYDNMLGWEWDFGDNTSTVSGPNQPPADQPHMYLEEGIYEVTLTVWDSDSSATDTHILNITYVGPNADFTWDPENPDEGEDVDFTDNTTSDDPLESWEWDFDGDGITDSTERNPTHAFDQEGNYTVTLTVTDDEGLSDSHTENIIVGNNAPVIDFTGTPVNGTEPLDVHFECNYTGGNEPVEVTIVFGDGSAPEQGTGAVSVDHTYNEDGQFTATCTIVDVDNDQDSDSIDIEVFDSEPTVDFTWEPEPSMEGDTVEFNSTADAHDGISLYEWDLDGDGIIDSTAEDPSWQYDEEGVYTVTLTVTDGDGSEATVQHNVTVLNNPPQADLQVNATSGDEPLTVEFVCLAYDGNEPITLLLDTGDGHTAQVTAGTPILHTYTQNGTYQASCTATDADGDEDVDEETITVFDTEPQVSWEYEPADPDEGEAVDFNATISGYDQPLDIQWDFDDGDTSVDEDPTHVFDAEGTYHVTLTVVDADGSEVVVAQDIIVQTDAPDVVLDATPLQGPEGTDVEFTCTWTDGNAPFEWYIDFGDGSDWVYNQTTVHHVYDMEGAYQAVCHVDDSDGDFGEDQLVINIDNNAPNMTLSVNPQEGEEPLEVSAVCSVADGNGPFDYVLDFGDGTQMTGDDEAPTFGGNHTYTQDGIYTIQCDVVDADGDPATQSVDVNVTDSEPSVSFVYDPLNPIEGDQVDFDATIDAYDTPVSILWNFGEGTTSTEEDPFHEYPLEGDYNVTLEVTDNDGSTVTVWELVTVGNNAPFVNLDADPVVGPENTNVTFNCSYTGGNAPHIVEIDFDGDGIVDSSSEEDWHVFTQPGSYEAVCAVTDHDGDWDSDSIVINIDNNPPVIDSFTAVPDEGPEGTEVDFDCQVSGGDEPLVYEIDFGDGTGTSSDSQVSHTYPLEGVYTATCTVTDNDGDFDVQDLDVNITNNPPLVNLVANNTNDLEPLSVAFDCLAGQGNEPFTYEIDFGDGSPIVNADHAEHVYPTEGNWVASCTVTDTDGDIGSDDEQIIVQNNPPVINYVVNPTEGPEGTEVDFDCQVSGGNEPLTYVIDYGDGSMPGSNAQESHTYPLEGVYTTSCLVTDNDGDFDYVEQDVNITNNPPIVNLVANNTNDLEPLSVAFDCLVGQGNEPFTYEIDFGDGSPIVNADHAEHVYPTEGNWVASCTVTDTDGDIGSDDEQIIVQNNPPVINYVVNPTEGPEGTEVDFDCQITGGNEPMVVEVGYGDGTTTTDLQSSYTYPLEGVYTTYCSVTDNDGDSDYVEQIVNITDNAPIVDVLLNTTSGSEPLSVQIDCSVGNGNEPFSYEIDFGDGSAPVSSDTAEHTYPVPGHYDITCNVVDTDGDTGSDTETVYVQDNPPVINFVVMPTEGPEGTEVDFDCQVTGGNEPLSYTIDFGDGSPSSSDSQVTHVYPSEGFYTASCTVLDNDGDSDYEEQEINITNNVPVVSLQSNVTAGDEPLDVEFTCLVGGGNEPYSYEIDFGDGSVPVTSDTAVHTYAIPGLYDAQCTVVDTDGDIGSDTQSISVADDAPAVTLVADPTTGPEGQSVDFDCQVAGGNEPYSYVLDFGDGASTTNAQATHEYPLEGTYNATCTVTDNDGDVGQDSQIVDIYNNPPVTNLIPNVSLAEEPETVLFNCTVGNGNEPFSYVLDFGDGSPQVTTSTAEHTYPQNGDYEAWCQVTDTDGDVDTDYEWINITDSVPTAEFNHSTPAIEGQGVDFFDLSTSYDGIASWEWDFGDNTTSTIQNPVHVFMEDGNYLVELTVTDNDGSTDSYSEVVVVQNDAPTVQLSVNPDEGPEPLINAQVLCTVTSGGNAPFDYQIVYGDGDTTTNPLTSHDYLDDGLYGAICTVTDNDGDVGMDMVTVNVTDTEPTADFTWTPLNPGTSDTVDFTDLSTAPHDPIVSWEWDFDNDGTVDSNDQNPSHNFATAGNYLVNLTVTDDDGSTSWAAKTVSVNATPDAPLILNVQVVTLTNESATITWATDQPADSLLEWGLTQALGSSMSDASLVYNHSMDLTGLTENTTYYYNITSCNSIAKCTTNGVMNFTTLSSADNVPPAPVLNLGETSVVDTWIEWSWTNPGDADFSHVEVWIDGVYETDVSGETYNATGFAPGSLHNIEVIPVDTMGNRNDPGETDDATTTGGGADTQAPVVTLELPADGSTDTDGDVTVQWSVTDETAASLTCNVYSDTSGAWSAEPAQVVANATSDILDFLGLSDGTYTWNVECSDGTNSASAAANWTFDVNTTVVDVTAPTVTLMSPPDGYVDADGNITVMYSVEDDLAGTMTCDIYSNTTGVWQADLVGQSTGNASSNIYDYTGLTDGTYIWNVECSDGTNSASAPLDFTFGVNTSGSGSSVPAVVAVADAVNGNAPLTVNFDAVTVGGDLPLTYAWDFDDDGITDSTSQTDSYVYNTAGTYNASVEVCDADMDCDQDYVIIFVGSTANRDVAVTSMTHDKIGTTTYLWDNVEVNATVENQGDVTEFVSVELEADGTVVDTQVVSIDPGLSELVTLNWASADPDGWRNLQVRAVPVPGESDLSDQSQVDQVEVWSVEDIVSNSTREIFLDSASVGIGGTFDAYLPIQNDYALENFEDLEVELSYNTGAFTVLSPAEIQYVDLPAGNLVTVNWTIQADGPAGNYAFSASLGNNEITPAEITAKAITVA